MSKDFPLLCQIQLVLGTESSIGVGWQKKEEKMSAAGEVKVRLYFKASLRRLHSSLLCNNIMTRRSLLYFSLKFIIYENNL